LFDETHVTLKSGVRQEENEKIYILLITFGVETVLGVKTIVETVEATVLAFTSLLVDPKIPTIHSFVGVNTFAAISYIRQS